MNVEEWTDLKFAKPCRFCGAGEEHKRIKMADFGGGRYKVVCRNCHAETAISNFDHARFLWDTGVYTIPSHSEKEILKGCLSLMQDMMNSFAEYIDYIGIDLEDGEEPFRLSYTMTEIVRKLFLEGTNHSGGTSTHAKIEELGIEEFGGCVVFEMEDFE